MILNEKVRERIEKMQGKKFLYLWEVYHIAKRLHYSGSRSSLGNNRNFRDNSVDPKELGIVTGGGFAPRLYSYEVVENALRALSQNHTLVNRDNLTLERMIELGYHEPERYPAPSTRKEILEDGQESPYY